MGQNHHLIPFQIPPPFPLLTSLNIIGKNSKNPKSAIQKVKLNFTIRNEITYDQSKFFTHMPYWIGAHFIGIDLAIMD